MNRCAYAICLKDKKKIKTKSRSRQYVLDYVTSVSLTHRVLKSFIRFQGFLHVVLNLKMNEIYFLKESFVFH